MSLDQLRGVLVDHFGEHADTLTDQHLAEIATAAAAYPTVAGSCPMGCGKTLFLGEGNHVTCSHVDCTRPTAVDELLAEAETDHVVTFGAQTFTIRHPLRERVELPDLASCDLHGWIQRSAVGGPPTKPGVFRARAGEGGTWTFEEIPTEEEASP